MRRQIRTVTGLTALLAGIATVSSQAQVLEEVVVTAQKRAESLHNVATALTVFSGTEVHELGINEPRDLAMQTPGLLTKRGPNGLATIGFYMRGVGINDFTGTVDPSVGVYVDEVFKATPDMLNFAVFDLERVEVLKGPQGTLYGRNSTGGAVNFISAAPTEDIEGHLRAGYSSYETGNVEAVLSGPITENLLGRVSFSGSLSSSDSGYSHNRLTGNTLGKSRSAAVRGQLRWLPTDDLDVHLIYNYGYQNSEQPLLEHIGALDPVALGNGIIRICDPIIAGRRSEGECVGLTGYFDPDNDPYDGAADIDPHMRIESHSITGKINYEFPRFTFTSITGYEDFSKNQTQDLDASPAVIGNNDTFNDVTSFSQEVRLTSNETWPFSWMLGAFYFDSTINWLQTIDISDVVFPTTTAADQDTESWAVFVHASTPLGEKFEIEGGLRFTHEERTWTGGSFIGLFGSLNAALASGVPPLSALPIPPSGTLAGDLPGGLLDFDNRIEEDNVDFKVALKYHATDDLMLFVSVSEAFRSGGFSSALVLSQPALEPFDEESLRAYEGGFKLDFLDGRAQLSATAYYYDFEGFQALFIRGVEVSGRMGNAGDVDIIGAEAQLKWLITENLLVDLGFNWLDNEIADTDVALQPLDGGPPTTIKGNEIPNAPSFSFNGRGRYEFPVIRSFLPYLQMEFTYVDDHYLEPNNRRVLREDGYFLLNGRLGVSQPNGPWEAAVWVKNLTDETYLSAGQDVMLGLGFGEWIFGAPRTIGVEVGYNF